MLQKVVFSSCLKYNPILILFQDISFLFFEGVKKDFLGYLNDFPDEVFFFIPTHTGQ